MESDYNAFGCSFTHISYGFNPQKPVNVVNLLILPLLPLFCKEMIKTTFCLIIFPCYKMFFQAVKCFIFQIKLFHFWSIQIRIHSSGDESTPWQEHMLPTAAITLLPEGLTGKTGWLIRTCLSQLIINILAGVWKGSLN